jgi:hypothetical protein
MSKIIALVQQEQNFPADSFYPRNFRAGDIDIKKGAAFAPPTKKLIKSLIAF